MAGALKARVGGAWTYVKGIKGDKGDKGDPGGALVNAGDVLVDQDALITNRSGSAVEIAPPTTTDANQLAPSITGLRWRRGDYVTPLDFGGVGDGTTDDYAAIMAAHDALGPKGGMLNFGGLVWRSTQTLTLTVPVHIEGGGGGITTGTAQTAKLTFPPGVPGVILASDSGPSIRNLILVGGNDAPGTADGLTLRAAYAVMEQVLVTSFNRHGVYLDGDSSVGHNVDNSTLIVVRSLNNKGDGIRLYGADANIVTLIGCDATSNGGYGINNMGNHNIVMNCIAASNQATVTNGTLTSTVDYRACGIGSIYLNPYSEGSKAFLIETDPAAVGSVGGRLELFGSFGKPVIWSGRADTASYQPTPRAAYATGWNIVADSGVRYGTIDLRSPDSDQSTASGSTWQIAYDVIGTGSLNIRQKATARTPLGFWADGSKMLVGDGIDLDVGTTTGTKIGQGSTRKLGFWGATPVVRPSAYTNSSGVAADKTLAAYTSNPQSTAYTGAADGEAKLADLNALRTAYETLRTKVEDDAAALSALITDLKAVGLIG